MSKIPPVFGDLGKNARDLFEKEFGKWCPLVGEMSSRKLFE